MLSLSSCEQELDEYKQRLKDLMEDQSALKLQNSALTEELTVMRADYTALEEEQ